MPGFSRQRAVFSAQLDGPLPATLVRCRPSNQAAVVRDARSAQNLTGCPRRFEGGCGSLPGHAEGARDGTAGAQGMEQESQPVRPIKHSLLALVLANGYYKLRSRTLDKVVLTATTGRSGTLALAHIFEAVPGCLSLHEAYPVMNGEVLTAANREDPSPLVQRYWRIKAVNIRRRSAGYRYYFEGNHEFIKTFVAQAAREFAEKLEVIHLVRPPLEVAMSIYRLQDQPGTAAGNRWWLDHRAPLNRIRLADVLDGDAEFAHPFYKALWYWFEVEARIREWQRQMPDVPFHRFETAWLNEPDRVLDLMKRLGVRCAAEQIAPRIGARLHAREAHKTIAAIPDARAQQMLDRFRELLVRRGLA
jgi:hypothetical protein